jgi:hypothetical protein
MDEGWQRPCALAALAHSSFPPACSGVHRPSDPCRQRTHLTSLSTANIRITISVGQWLLRAPKLQPNSPFFPHLYSLRSLSNRWTGSDSLYTKLDHRPHDQRMENLTISDAPPHQGGGPMPPPQMMLGPGGPAPPQQQQLPAQMFTTAAQLLDLTDSMYFRCWYMVARTQGSR